MSKYYAGIGSRSTPSNVLQLMTKLADQLEEEGWVLRSGGAEGADTAFESGVNNPFNKQIFLPSNHFNNRSSREPGILNSSQLPDWGEALKTIERYHPAPERLSTFALKLMARNAMQVLGPDLKTPSSFILCFTPKGEVTGGTGQALSIALECQIPIINLGDSSIYERLLTGSPLKPYILTLLN